MRLPASEAEPEEWKGNFMNDLKPYVCLVIDCHSESVTYQSRNLWIGHERSAHPYSRTKWIRDIVPYTPFESSGSEEAFRDHANDPHKDTWGDSIFPERRYTGQITRLPPLSRARFVQALSSKA